MPSPHYLLQLPLILHPFTSQTHLTSSPTCPNPSLSCPSSPPTPLDTCCLNHPSGHFLLAQFWDTTPPLGPTTSWTLHGLWPDLCTGGYEQFCNDTRNLGMTEIETIVNDAADTGLKAYMDEFWKGLSGDASLWMHEWNKHGTCVSTIEPRCYDDGADDHADLLDYFTAATALHSTLQTHAVLAAHDILPSWTQTYSLAAVQTALRAAHGHVATVKCNYRGELNEIWMHYTIRGSLRNFTDVDIFYPTGPDGIVSTCPSEGIKYLPKGASDSPPTPPPPVPTGPPFEGRGYLNVKVLDEYEETEGCLIRQGAWYTSGTCATYRAMTDAGHLLAPSGLQDSHVFTLTSGAGPCAVLDEDSEHGVKGEFVCAMGLPLQSIFGSEGDGEKEVLTRLGQKVFYAENRPGRFEKVRVFSDDGNGERGVKIEVYWEGV